MSLFNSVIPSAKRPWYFGLTPLPPPPIRSSSLYLFTFLITIVVLGVISAGLLLRAYYVRRQFQRRVEEAIRAGQPLPHDAATALGLNRRRKQEKKHGPMPGVWEAQMWRDGEKWDGLQSGPEWDGIMVSSIPRLPYFFPRSWVCPALPPSIHAFRSRIEAYDHIQPLSVTHAAPPPTPPPTIEPSSLMPQPRGPWFLRPFLTPRLPDLNGYIAAHPDPNRPDLHRTLTVATLPPVKPAWTIPQDGEEVVIGVMIAMPVEGKQDEKWDADGEDEDGVDVPEVCLGVTGCKVNDE